MGAEVGWHLRMVQARVVDVWADLAQMSVFTEVAATFPAWRMATRTEDGVFKVRFSMGER